MDNIDFLFGDRYRIFLNTSIGCSSSCSYCYLKKIDCPVGNSEKTTISADKLITYSINFSDLNYGKSGTIISIGCYSDPWDDINRSHTKRLINFFIKFGNPIQISTKHFVDSKDLIDLQDKIQWFGQLSVYISCSTITNWTNLERGTIEPFARFKSFNISKNLDIPSILYIKPVIKDVTVKDVKIFAEIVERYNIDSVVGSNFAKRKSSISSPIANNILFYDINTDEKIIKQVLTKSCKVYTYSTEFIEMWRKKMFDKSKVLAEARELIYHKNYSTIYDALNYATFPNNLIASMLFACGYAYVQEIEDNEITKFLTGNDPNDLDEKIIFSKTNKTLSGKSKNFIEKAYQLVRAIEHQLTSASLLPPNLRNEAINKVCKNIDIDQQFYKTVLTNWSE